MTIRRLASLLLCGLLSACGTESAVDQGDLVREGGSEWAEYYAAGDLDGLMEHLVAYMQNDDLYDDLLSRLIHQRNVQMAESITTLVSQNPGDHFFFAVGAGHFWGDGSIIELLEEQGYTIESVE